MRLRARPLLALTLPILLAVTAGLYAQQADRANALRRADRPDLQGARVQPPRFGPARWLPDGTAYAIVERPAAGEGSEIVRYDAATGARTVLVPASTLIPPGAKPAGAKAHKPAKSPTTTWSPDGKTLLIFTNTQNGVAPKHARRLLDPRRRERSAEEVGAALAGVVADVREVLARRLASVAYVRANNIYVEPLGDGAVVQLTPTDRTTTINGTSDWVYEEELGVRDGFRWSPDSQRIAYWQFDTTGVGVFSLINNTDDAVSGDHADSLSEGRHDQLRGAHRRRRLQTRRDALDEDSGRPARQLSRAPRVGRRGHRRDSAVEPAAEPARRAARRTRERRRATVSFATSRRRGSTSSKTSAGSTSGRAFLVDQRARRMAARVSRPA